MIDALNKLTEGQRKQLLIDLVDVCREWVEDDGGLELDVDDNTLERKACCGAWDYEPHLDACDVGKVRSILLRHDLLK